MESTMLGIAIDDLGDTAVVRCVGRIVSGREANVLRLAVLSQAKRRSVVLDLAMVEAIDAGGIGLLVSLERWTRTSGMSLKLMNPPLLVREVLELMNLDSVFEICLSPDAGLADRVGPAATADAAA